MEYGAIDLHKKESQIRIVTESGEVHRPPHRDDARAVDRSVLGPPADADSLEASTESEWVAQHLETLGHEVDRGRSELRGDVRPAQSTRQDGSARCRGADGRLSTWHLPRRRIADPLGSRTVQSQLNVRQELTQARTRAISLARAITRAAGLRIRQRPNRDLSRRGSPRSSCRHP